MAAFNKQDICFILLPGFSPDNVPVLGMKKQLENEGYQALAATFWGKNETADFRILTIEDCEKQISSLIATALRQYKYIIGIGISLGGALLLEHAKKNNDLYCVVSIGTPFKLKNRFWIRLGFMIYPLLKIIWYIREKSGEQRLLPIASSRMVWNYLKGKFLDDLDKLQTPVLLLQSEKDAITDYRSAAKYIKKIGSPKREIIYVNGTNHVVEYDGLLITRLLFGFLNGNGQGSRKSEQAPTPKILPEAAGTKIKTIII